MRHTTAQATSTKANHRPASRSQRTCSRWKQLSHDSTRSTFQRWRPSLIERVAGLDVHKASVTANVRVAGGRRGTHHTEPRTFRTTTAGLGLVLLSDWLDSFGVQVVGMESTGVFRKPVVRHEVPRVRAEVKGLRRRPVAAGR